MKKEQEIENIINNLDVFERQLYPYIHHKEIGIIWNKLIDTSLELMFVLDLDYYQENFDERVTHIRSRKKT